MNHFKAGNYISQGYYKSFQPEFINKQWVLEDMELQQLLSQADRQLGRLDMFSEYIPNIDLFISMHVAKEATKSSKIEGTQTNIEEAFLKKEEVPGERRDDWEEVQNYIIAMDAAIRELKELPFSSRLIKNTHRVLLQSVRGEKKQPGEFRTSQNWIGGASINDAVFIPPAYESIPELMNDLEKFAHNNDIYMPELLKIGLIHYQFETIHPFLDGNGRIGRLMITLYLVEKGILKHPILYLSDFFERNRDLYYDNLMRVRTHNDIKQWFKFFLVGINETAKKGVQTFEALLALKADIEERVKNNSGRVPHIMKILDYLYVHPIINVKAIGEITGVSIPTSYKLAEELIRLGVLEEQTSGKRDRFFVFAAYINLFQS